VDPQEEGVVSQVDGALSKAEVCFRSASKGGLEGSRGPRDKSETCSWNRLVSKYFKNMEGCASSEQHTDPSNQKEVQHRSRG